MAKVSFVPENKVETKSIFPKLKLKLNETARIAYIEDPEKAYVHTLQSPVIGEDGKPEKEWVTPRDKSKEPFEVTKKEFIGRPMCLGDVKVIETKGADPDNCPACAAALKRPALTDKPEPRYAMHVAKYQVKPGTFTVSEPFVAEIFVWGFTKNIFNQLIDINEDFPLTKHDLKLGPCESPEHMQKFKIAVGGASEWLKSDPRKKFVRDAFENNHADDLESYIGWKVDAARMEDDLLMIKQKWDIANGKAAPDTKDETASALTNLISGAKKSEVEPVVAIPNDDDDSPKPRTRRSKAVTEVDDSSEEIVTPSTLSFSDLGEDFADLTSDL